MKYPSMQEVEAASHEQLGIWWRFLPSPGNDLVDSIDEHAFYTLCNKEAEIMIRIGERFKAMRMFTPGLSKSIGLDPKKYE